MFKNFYFYIKIEITHQNYQDPDESVKAIFKFILEIK